MSQGVRDEKRRGLHREAALLSGGGPGSEDRGAGALLWQARPRERDPKKGAGEIPLERRHAMITEAREDRCAISERELCRVFWGEPLLVPRAPGPRRESPTGRQAERCHREDSARVSRLRLPPGHQGTPQARMDGEPQEGVLRVMREESLLCRLKRHFKPTIDSTHPFGRYPNLVKETVVDAPDAVWLADITYVRLPTSFCYLASIIDDYSRYCLGWSLSRFIGTRLTLCALEMALAARRPAPGLIHHSDQGVQYASSEY